MEGELKRARRAFLDNLLGLQASMRHIDKLEGRVGIEKKKHPVMWDLIKSQVAQAIKAMEKNQNV